MIFLPHLLYNNYIMIKTILSISLVPFLVTISQIFLKKGLIKTGGIKIGNLSEFAESFLKLFQEIYIYIGVFIAVVGAFIWLIIISRKDLTLAFPISSAIFFIILFLFSWLFLGENITIWRIIGTAIILIGISMLFK